MMLNKRGGMARSRSSRPPSQHCVGRVERKRSHPQWMHTLTCSNTLIGWFFSLAEKAVVFWPADAAQGHGAREVSAIAREVMRVRARPAHVAHTHARGRAPVSLTYSSSWACVGGAAAAPLPCGA